MRPASAGVFRWRETVAGVIPGSEAIWLQFIGSRRAFEKPATVEQEWILLLTLFKFKPSIRSRMQRQWLRRAAGGKHRTSLLPVEQLAAIDES